ncbi:hypothetical protein VTL71DRAFT_838 [Oculimacula yallundae]|uniref:SAP domain-containing protein n=1 Tax=Oculimacula yallundae TaxID=86028 RepID=A0ABR4D161_9HELO
MSSLYNNIVLDSFSTNVLESLLEEHGLSSHGDDADLRGRLQQYYLGWEDPSSREVKIVRGFFTPDMTKTRLVEEIEGRGFARYSTLDAQDLRRFLAIIEMKIAQEKSVAKKGSKARSAIPARRPKSEDFALSMSKLSITPKRESVSGRSDGGMSSVVDEIPNEKWREDAGKVRRVDELEVQQAKLEIQLEEINEKLEKIKGC